MTDVRPKYAQTHPLMRVARNIVNQILDEAGTDVETRQRINDDCDQFVAWMIEDRIAAARNEGLDALLARADEGIEFGPDNYLRLCRMVRETRVLTPADCIECGDHRGWRVEPDRNTGDAVQVQCRACSEHVCPTPLTPATGDTE